MKVTASTRALRIAGNFWFLAALAGLWLFVYYLVGVYVTAAFSDDFEAWSNASLIGYRRGDIIGNVVFAAHIVMAVVISFGGVLQLVPAMRKNAPAFHRWNGRVFIVCTIAISLGGFYLIWVRGATSSLVNAIGISLNGLLMLWFAMRAITLARAGNIKDHRVWALRTFIVANGVWFFRVGLFGWIMINQGPVGIGENFDGPFIKVWSFLNYLLPLALLELYLVAQTRAGSTGKSAMTALLVVATLIMVAGTFGAFMFMWLPELQR